MLYELPNGAFVRLADVTGIRPHDAQDGRYGVVVFLGQHSQEMVFFPDIDIAKVWARHFAQAVNADAERAAKVARGDEP